jgi:hypothetical protein
MLLVRESFLQLTYELPNQPRLPIVVVLLSLQDLVPCMCSLCFCSRTETRQRSIGPDADVLSVCKRYLHGTARLRT